MRKIILRNLGAIWVAMLAAGGANAADQSGVEAKLRETLRNTMLQLRTSQTDLANLQAVQAESDQKIKQLTAKLDSLIRQGAEDKKNLDELNDKYAGSTAENAKLKATLEQNRESLKQTADLAKAKEEQRTKLADDSILLQRHIAELQHKNRELFKLGNEILSRYEKFGLGTGLTAREPFTGLTRTKLENLVQDYQDKLSDQLNKL